MAKLVRPVMRGEERGEYRRTHPWQISVDGANATVAALEKMREEGKIRDFRSTGRLKRDMRRGGIDFYLVAVGTSRYIPVSISILSSEGNVFDGRSNEGTVTEGVCELTVDLSKPQHLLARSIEEQVHTILDRVGARTLPRPASLMQ